MLKKILQNLLPDFFLIILMTVIFNYSFFSKTYLDYKSSGGISFLSWANLSLLVIVAQVLIFRIILLPVDIFSSIKKTHTAKKLFIFFIILMSSIVAYAMDSFGVVFDQTMILNVLKTAHTEAFELVNAKFWIYLVFAAGVFICINYVISKKNVPSFKELLIDRLITFPLIVLTAFVLIYVNSPFYSSFFRAHKSLRYNINPSYWVYNSIYFSSSQIFANEIQFSTYGRDAKINKDETDRKLVIFVLGETARSDHFSLNGYPKETNPLLKNMDVLSFKNVSSCGTATAISVPCMFSHLKREDFDGNVAKNTENLLDILTHTKDVSVLWRDNNSNSRGVANRVIYEDFRDSKVNPNCDEECRDIGMLVGLDEFIKTNPKKDIFIVLHMLGNHGPAYYKRYPKEFEKFKPTCKTSLLEKCSNEEIKNAYDNVLVYTDYFLSEVINLLKRHSNDFSSMMYYVSDHGESLGENGVYLHSMPYALAPRAQTHVPMIWWMDDKFKTRTGIKNSKDFLEKDFSHDNIFHTVLGLFKVETIVYDKNLDILQQ